jgi:hypothetical protein
LHSGLREADFGNSELARQQVKAALAITSSRDAQILAALTLARVGDIARAQVMSEELAKQFPANTLLDDYWLPTIRGYESPGLEKDGRSPATLPQRRR